MSSVICVSQYFTNKQNVRTFGNIYKINLLQCDVRVFFNHLFEDEEYLVRELTTDLKLLLCNLRSNLRNKSRDDFRQYFPKEHDRIDLRSVAKEFIFENVWKALRDIIPSLFIYGKNLKLFRCLVETIVFSMRRQHFIITKYVDKWDYSSSLWKPPHFKSKQILIHILNWIFKNIISAMISLNFYVTTCKIDGDENKLHYFWKSQWQSFYDKKISEMIFTRIIVKYEPYCLGKKVKRKIGLTERKKVKLLKRDIPKLHFVLKNNNDYRPIVRYRSNSQNVTEKYKMKERLRFLKLLNGPSQKKVEDQFYDFYKKWLKMGKPKLYFVKSDLSNAFGLVNKEKLIKILCERHTQFQNSDKIVDLKKKMAIHFKEIVSEHRMPLLIRVGSNVFEWKEGLVQGYKYSPALSELYYKYLDELYFSKHLIQSENRLTFFRRVVDDYLYITSSLEDAHCFLNALSKYRNVNYSKTVVNFPHLHIQFSNNIIFLGSQYNTQTLEVSRSNNVFVGQMCYKIAFTNAIADIDKFLENRIGQSANPISNHLFNFLYNTEEFIWKHVFTTFCMSANKFCTTLAILCDCNEMCNYLTLYKKRVVVKLTNSMIETLMRNKPVDFKFVFCVNHFRYVAWKALYLCAKGTSKCSVLVPSINDELAKTNCLFGKWKDHARFVTTSGDILRPAIKDICRRIDLRAIVNKFDKLPNQMECYNHRKVLNKT